MEMTAFSTWSLLRWLPGKTGPQNSNLWLPTWVHLWDTASVMRNLCSKWIPDSVRNATNLKDDLDRFSFFVAFVHDIGKFSSDFVHKISTSRNITELPPDVKENLRRIDVFNDSYTFTNSYSHRFLGAQIFEELSDEFPVPKGIQAIVAAHHGKPLEANEMNHNSDCMINLYGQKGENGDLAQIWRKLWREWLDFSMKQAGYTHPSELPMPDVKTQMLLCGLLIVADWIASNTAYFPLIEAGDTGENLDLEERADTAWRNLGLPAGWMPGTFTMDEEAFRDKFNFLPNSVQRAFMQAVQESVEPGIFILEAQMGVGKTEAALCGAELLSARKNSGGIFFGLPTQATANGIFPRVLDWSEKQADEIKLAVRLAHGMAALNQDYNNLFEQSHSNYTDETGGLVVHSFFSGRKQALMANVVVGTVDQLLMVALKQKHVMLRHLGISGKIVIIDECHAYDAYMNQYLDRALCWLGQYGVPVIILSATLPLKRRTELIKAYLNVKNMKDGAWKENRGYPLLTWTDGESVCQKVLETDTEEKTVTIHRLSDENHLDDLLREKLSGGGCAGVIVNTVKRAQGIAEFLREKLPDKTVILTHAHFLMPDRAEREKKLLALIGKKSTPKQRNNLIVVGTQVLEQSLDIDFDFMVTDLCPMDLLLQRLGRLQRHTARNAERPPLLHNAECYVMGAGEELESGAKYVYGEWLLYRTRELLPKQITMPTDIPNLVQDTYQEPVFSKGTDATTNETAKSLWNAFEDNQKSNKIKADAFKLSAPKKRGTINGMLDTVLPIASSDNEKTKEERAEAAVRDGEPSISVLVMMCYRETEEIGFLPWQNGGRRFSASSLPSEADCKEIARQQMRLPAAFSKDGIISRVINELEDRTRSLAEWQQSHWLKGELFLLLDENFETSLSGYSLHYDKEFGLIYDRKDKEENELG